MQSAMLPAVSEALSLLDVSFVNNDGNSSPAAIRRAVQILVDHVQVQHAQLSRIEDILAAFGNPNHPGGTIWAKIASKAEQSRVEQLESQLDGALDETSQLRSKQAESAARQLELSRELEATKQQIALLEARVGTPGAVTGATGAHTQLHILASSSPRVGSPGAISATATLGAAAAGGTAVAGGSLLDRVHKLERRADILAASTVKNQDDAADSLGRLRELDARLEGQLAALRADIKQALVLSAAAARDLAASEAATRTKELEKRTLTRIASVEEALESRMSGLAVKVGTSLSQELDTRFTGLYDHVDQQVAAVRGDMDRLARDKVDVTSLDAYTSRVTTSFEQVASTLGDEIKGVADGCSAQVDGLRLEVKAALEGKADQAVCDDVAQHGADVASLQKQIEALAAGLTATDSKYGPVVVSLQEGLSHANAQADSAAASISGLNTAVSSTSSALELQAHKISALGHRLQSALNEVAGLRDALFGSSGSVAASALESVTATLGSHPATTQVGSVTGTQQGLSLGSRLAAAERGLTEVAALLSGKVDEAALREVSRQLVALQRQADLASEGIRSLTQSTYKRVDEHASAIQKLTLAINSHMEERPTVTAVKHMLEASGLEVGERLASALLPVWDAVKALQSGVRDLGADVRDTNTQLPPLKQQVAELRGHITGSSGLLASLISCGVEEQVGAVLRAPGTGIETRISTAEAELRNAKSQLEVLSAVQDRQTAIVAAVEDQLSVQQGNLKATASGLRTELGSRIDTGIAALEQRVEAAELGLRQLVANTKEVVEQLGNRPVLNEVLRVAETAVATAQLAASDKEEARWQAWVELHARQMERFASKSQLDEAVTAAVAIAKQAASAAESAGMAAAHQAESRAAAISRSECDARIQAVDTRINHLGARVDAAELALESCVSQQDLAALHDVLGTKADSESVEGGLRNVSDSLTRQMMLQRHALEAEIAKKLDVRTYLASSSAAAAANAAAASVVPPQQSQHIGVGVSTAPTSPAAIRTMDIRSSVSPTVQRPASGGRHNSNPGALQPPVMGVGSAAAAAAIARLGEKLRNAAKR